MIKRKNILILRHMELLERTRLGITNFLNVPTNDSGSLWPSSKILKRVFFDDFAKLIRSQKYFWRFGTYSKVKLQVFVFSVTGNMTSKEFRKFNFHVEVDGTSCIPKCQGIADFEFYQTNI